MNKEKLHKTFADWPSTNRFWVTSDDECFFTEPRAIKHANALSDKRIAIVRRADMNKVEPAPEVVSTPEITLDENKEVIQAEDPKPVKAKTTKKTK